MALNIPVFYGSYRRDRKGIRLARYIVSRLEARGDRPELIDAMDVGLPILDRMYKEYDKGEAPEAMERVAQSLRKADAFIIVSGEYNQGVQPGLKNLMDHFLEEYFWRPSGIATYSMGRFAGVRAMMNWRTSLAEMGMPSVSQVFSVGQIHKTLSEDGEPTDQAHDGFEKSFTRFADDLAWWAEAAKVQRAKKDPPY